MKNQLLETLLKIQKKIYKTKDNSIPQLLENNKDEIDFIKSKFNIDDVESLFLATTCIITISDCDFDFGIDEISFFLAINNLEVLLHKDSLQNLIDKQLLLVKNTDTKTTIPFLEIEFTLHSSIIKHFN